MANSPQMEIPQFVSSKVDGHLGCFYPLATVNSAAMNIHVVGMEEHAPAGGWLSLVPGSILAQ